MLDTGHTGAKVQTWRRNSPRELLKRLMEEKPTDSKEAILEALQTELKDDVELLDAVIEYWFTNNYNSLVASLDPIAPVRRNESVKRIADTIKSKIIEEAQILLLDTMMPNGKVLRYCTGQDCSKMGGWLGRIAKKVKPRQNVGSALSEDQVRELFGK